MVGWVFGRTYKNGVKQTKIMLYKMRLIRVILICSAVVCILSTIGLVSLTIVSVFHPDIHRNPYGLSTIFSSTLTLSGLMLLGITYNQIMHQTQESEFVPHQRARIITHL